MIAMITQRGIEFIQNEGFLFSGGVPIFQENGFEVFFF